MGAQAYNNLLTFFQRIARHNEALTAGTAIRNFVKHVYRLKIPKEFVFAPYTFGAIYLDAVLIPSAPMDQDAFLHARAGSANIMNIFIQKHTSGDKGLLVLDKIPSCGHPGFASRAVALRFMATTSCYEFFNDETH